MITRGHKLRSGGVRIRKQAGFRSRVKGASCNRISKPTFGVEGCHYTPGHRPLNFPGWSARLIPKLRKGFISACCIVSWSKAIVPGSVGAVSERRKACEWRRENQSAGLLPARMWLISGALLGVDAPSTVNSWCQADLQTKHTLLKVCCKPSVHRQGTSPSSCCYHVVCSCRQEQYTETYAEKYYTHPHTKQHDYNDLRVFGITGWGNHTIGKYTTGKK